MRIKPSSTFVASAVVGYVLAAGIFLFVSDSRLYLWFRDPHYLGAMALISALIILAPPVVFKTMTVRNPREVERLQYWLAGMLIATSAGGLGLYELYAIGFQYDKFIHFINPALLVVLFARFFGAMNGVSPRKYFIPLAITVLIAGFAWEGWEAFSDRVFGTMTWGLYRNDIYRDTVIDLAANLAGVLAGGALLLAKDRRTSS